MEKENIICGYHTMINWDKTGEELVTALIEVKVTPQRNMGFEKIAERIYQYSEVNSVYLMSGAYDFTVIVEGKTMLPDRPVRFGKAVHHEFCLEHSNPFHPEKI